MSSTCMTRAKVCIRQGARARLSAGDSSGSSGLMRVTSVDTVYSAAATSAEPQSSPSPAGTALCQHSNTTALVITSAPAHSFMQASVQRMTT